MGHGIESGFGLIDDDGAMFLLEPDATNLVVQVIRDSERSEGIRLGAARERDGGQMKTVRVEEAGHARSADRPRAHS